MHSNFLSLNGSLVLKVFPSNFSFNAHKRYNRQTDEQTDRQTLEPVKPLVISPPPFLPLYLSISLAFFLNQVIAPVFVCVCVSVRAYLCACVCVSVHARMFVYLLQRRNLTVLCVCVRVCVCVHVAFT